VRAAAFALVALAQMFTPPLRVVGQGTTSNIDDARTVTIRDQAAWAELWRAHAPDAPVPAVDWAREIVVGVFLGTRPTAGFSVEIVGYREEGGRVVAGYRERRPAKDAIAAQILTSPYALAAIPRPAGDAAVVFQKID
jgi:PrcB C-terminal